VVACRIDCATGGRLAAITPRSPPRWHRCNLPPLTKKRANPQIVTNAPVHRVVIDGSGTVRVELSPQSGLQRVDAAREVISRRARRLAVSDAAIGRRRARGAAEGGRPCAHALPGVGQNFQAHNVARMSRYVRNLEALNERARELGFANGCLRRAASTARSIWWNPPGLRGRIGVSSRVG